jgi:hypothetical protein
MWRNECRVCLLISSSTSSRAGTVDRSENVGPLTRDEFNRDSLAVAAELVAGRQAGTRGVIQDIECPNVLSQG